MTVTMRNQLLTLMVGGEGWGAVGFVSHDHLTLQTSSRPLLSKMIQ